MKRLFPFAVLLVLAGCTINPQTRFPPPQGPSASSPSEQSSPAPPQQAPSASGEPAKTPPRTAAEASSPAVMSLLGRADTLAHGGHMDMAAATLERALDLEPRNTFVYQRLAAVRLAQGQSAQAEAMARKSNSVAGENPFVRADNWRLIAEARRAAGDRRGADEATARADGYRRTRNRMPK